MPDVLDQLLGGLPSANPTQRTGGDPLDSLIGGLPDHTPESGEGMMSRFGKALWSQINPAPAVQEFLNRPENMSQASRVAAAAVRVHAGHEQPGDRDLLEQAVKNPPNPPQPEGNIAAE